MNEVDDEESDRHRGTVKRGEAKPIPIQPSGPESPIRSTGE